MTTDKQKAQQNVKGSSAFEIIKNTILDGKYSLIFVAILIVYFWYPALFEGKTIIHGDSVHHGLPLFYTHIQSLFGNESILWSNKIYGGHPLFAEGQGGFANPLNILIALLFNPGLGHQLIHILGVAIAALGVFVLARQLNISYWGSTFAALAASFSTAWIADLHNYTVSATMAWIPWMMVAGEYWIKKPSSISAILLAVPTSLSILAGYPQYPYGAVIYIVASLFTLPLSSQARNNIKMNWKKYLWSGCLATLLFVGLTAVQMLPLTELIGQSHRAEGTGLVLPNLPSFLWSRGLLFTYTFDIFNEAYAINIPSVGSVMVVSLAIASIFMKMPNRMIGHLIATILLLNLGMQNVSPIFDIIYTYHLIPGLHYHRIMQIFLSVAVIGVSLLAAYFIDSTSKRIIPFWGRGRNKKTFAIMLLMGLSCLLLFALIRNFNKAVSIIQILTLLVTFSSIIFLRKKGWFYFIPIALTIVLFTECLLLRTDLFQFVPQHVANSTPKVVQSILNDPLLSEYKTHDNSGATGMVFLNPRHPNLSLATQRMMHALSSFPGLLKGLSSIDGATALPLGRRNILKPVLEDESLNAQNSNLNMIDILSVKYISTSQSTNNPALELLKFDEAYHIWVYRNKNVQPRFQIYCHAAFMNSYEEALKRIKTTEKRTLFLELPNNNSKQPIEITEGTNCENLNEKDILGKIRYIEKRSQRYELEISAPQSVWLFLADANYPGWEAKINDSPTIIYSAQVLGKAIKIKPGKNHVIIEYIPRMFYLGLSITISTIILILVIIIWHRRNSSFRKKQSKEKTYINTAT